MKRLLCCVVALIAPVANSDDWPQFRGPNCSGVSTSNAPLPVNFSSTDHVKWAAKLGDGIGCPVVAAGRVFTSAMVDDATIGLFAFDAASGEQLWMRSWAIGDIDEIHLTNSHAFRRRPRMQIESISTSPRWAW